MTAQLAPLPQFRNWDNNGNPLFLGQLFSYVAGTSTPQATYTDSTQSTPNPNPVQLNARGEASVWLDPTLTYKLVLQDSLGNVIWTQDNIPGGFLPFSQFTAAIIAGLLDSFTTAPILASLNRIAAEIAAGVIPTNYAYAPGDIRRYGADPTGVADSTTAIQNACKVAAVLAPTTGVYATVSVPAGNFLVSSTITINKSYVRIQGVSRNASTIYCATSGIGAVFLANISAAEIFQVQFVDIQVVCQAALGSPPVAFSFKDASECLVERCRATNCSDGILLNGGSLLLVKDYDSSGCVTGIHFTVQSTTVFNLCDTCWIQNVNLFGKSSGATAGILIGHNINHLSIRDSYIEQWPHGILLQNDVAGSAMLVDGLYLDSVEVWNSAGDTYSGTFYLSALPLSGSGSYLQMRNTVIANARSNQALTGVYHIQLRQNGNSNVNTVYTNTEILNGQFYSASTAVVFSDASTSCTGDIRGNVVAQAGYITGAIVPLRAGSGTTGTSSSFYWGTEESGTFTPNDASGASLTFSNVYGSYVRKGLMVTVTIGLTYPTTANGSGASIGNLPFTSISTAQSEYAAVGYSTAASAVLGLVGSNAATLALLNAVGGGTLTNTNMSTQSLRITFTYQSQ